MEKKLIIAFEIIFVIVAITYYVVKDLIPEYKTRFGSSDKIVNPEKCTNIIEIKINNDIDYIYLLDKEKKIYHLIFFTPSSMALYNKNLENNNIDVVLEESIKLLIENDYLKKDSSITIIRENNNDYNEFTNSLKNYLTKYNINTNITEETNNFIDKSIKLGLNAETRSTMITEMDYYSKELINNNSNRKTTKTVLNDKTSKTLTNTVYKKIEKYVISNNIDNLEINNTKLLISTIPADEDFKYYPTLNSWYYVENKKVYSYIELQEGDNKYGYCYKGSIDNAIEGECEVDEKN